MSDFFGGLRSGIQMPEVVWNQGPLPSGDGLPAPLHQTADARINYNSSLLGDLTPYAYGKPGYLSSQTAYLNIPHKIQKIVPVIWLPEARPNAKDVFDLPHPVDDGDIAFVLRLNRDSMFCTGTKNGDMRRMGLGTAVDPLINLPTLNYILSGLQIGLRDTAKGNLWHELFNNLDPFRFPGTRERDFRDAPVTLDDVVNFIRHCIKPFGVARGSEKQGGQDEATLGAATWPVNFVTSLTIDGKESNVVNIWHHLDLSAGDDMVLRLKLLPVKPYTLNHYYKGVKRQSWGQEAHGNQYVWQLVPDLLHLDLEGHASDKELVEYRQMMSTKVSAALRTLRGEVHETIEWQSLGFWHIGRSQIMSGRYGVEEYWHNDQANMLKTNHLDITFQPCFRRMPTSFKPVVQARGGMPRRMAAVSARPAWSASLGLERLGMPPASNVRGTRLDAARMPRERDGAVPRGDPKTSGMLSQGPADQGLAEKHEEPAAMAVHVGEDAPAAHVSGPVAGVSWLDETLLADAPAPPDASTLHEEELEVPVPGLAVPAGGGGGKKYQRGPKRRALSGSLIKVDGTSEASEVGLL